MKISFLHRLVPAALPQIWRDRAGVTALEYGIIASVMAIALVGIFKNLAATLAPIFTHIETSM